MMNPVPWLQMTNMISYQGLVRTFPKRCRGDQDAAEAGFNEGLKARLNHGVSGKDSALSLEYKS